MKVTFFRAQIQPYPNEEKTRLMDFNKSTNEKKASHFHFHIRMSNMDHF